MERSDSEIPQSEQSLRTAVGLAALLCFTFMLQVGAIRAFSDAQPYGDQAVYVQEADRILNGQRYEGTRGPAYSAFLAACSWAGGSSPRGLRFGNALLGTLLVAGVWGLARFLFSPRAGWIVAVLLALHPRYVVFPIYFFSEALYAPCVVWGLFFTARGIRNRRPMLLIVAGGVLGLGCLTREGLLYFLPVAGAVVIGLSRHHYASGVRNAALVIVPALLVVAPWTARNYVTYDRFAPAGFSSGIPLFMGNFQAPKRRDVADEMTKRYGEFLSQTNGNHVDADRLMKSDALDIIASRQPAWALEKVLTNGPMIFQPSVTFPKLWNLPSAWRSDDVRRVYLVLFLPLHAVLLALSALGWAHWRARSEQALLLAFLGFSVLIHLIANAGPSRFQMGYEWVMLIAVAVALDAGRPNASSRRKLAWSFFLLLGISQLAVADTWAQLAHW